MNNGLEFQPFGYQITRELGQNRAGGRITYQAVDIQSQQSVVIKQFQFAKSANWTDYDAYEREIQVLKQLDHPCIPRYLDSLETPTGFCLIQEYKEAKSLTQDYHFSLPEIKQIAIAILEVLVYLQQQSPPIIHRDIKPENILIDRSVAIKVYLVDFGFARQGGDDLAVSSVVKGTLGFMPPEQLFNRQLTKASDLYSLGMTLICLLTQTKSSEIGNLVNDQGQIKFHKLLPKGLNRQFIKWLEKMVSPNLKFRYPDAKTALDILKPIPILAENNLISVASLATLGIVVASGLGYLILKPNPPLDPSFSNLPQINLEQLLKTGQCPNCDLRGVNLSKKSLVGANLKNANLEGANLNRADLRRIILNGANLTDANLVNANLENSDLTDANLTNANLVKANLKRAYLENANLTNTNLNQANLEDTILWNVTK